MPMARFAVTRIGPLSFLVPVNEKGEVDWTCPRCGHRHRSCCGNTHFPCEKSPQYGGNCKCDYFDRKLAVEKLGFCWLQYYPFSVY